ncbi:MULTISPECIES: efflux RND transporter periplasmic adaptor subunit [unclassified Lentimicrobium]|uniref:efflux RND transporter periplasmic adaptor subunit n=1 Tax=unclassified Lentimicrobium TaxID=2677434 RepID=UPI001555B903|nr:MULTISPECIES: efflux RND transporter periplasmic adaptor subunit [unclassified Lentimicrobium]NPD44743.1 efflux RND transporter periplasmic adaptor subunit [Lentimicrobium sp. S6]NPD83401.1 efflux RND transporter periplasmic adaptor subunit [Lentimicrobium sp. L6]
MKTINLLRALILLLVSVFIFSSCTEQKKQLPPTQVTVVQVLQKDVPITHEFIGQTYGLYDIPIRARVQGFLEGIHFKEGTVVKKGDHLYSIDAQSYKADVAGQLSDVAGAKTGLVKAENDLNRYKPLAAANAVSQSDLDNAVAQYDASVAQVAAAQANYEIAQIELGYTEIYSPIDGIIGKTNAKVGEFVGQDPNPVILNTVSDVSSVNVEFFLPEAQYLMLARAFKGYLEKSKSPTADDDKYLELALSDGSIFEHHGDVVFIDREVNPSTGSILVQARFPNPEGLLRPGQYAKVRAHLNDIKDALLVPQSCVIELQGQYSVFIVDDSSHVQTVQVEMGPKYKDYWVVSKGLKSTDKVVFDGVQKVGNGMKVIAKEVTYKSKALKQ